LGDDSIGLDEQLAGQDMRDKSASGGPSTQLNGPWESLAHGWFQPETNASPSRDPELIDGRRSHFPPHLLKAGADSEDW